MGKKVKTLDIELEPESLNIEKVPVEVVQEMDKIVEERRELNPPPPDPREERITKELIKKKERAAKKTSLQLDKERIELALKKLKQEADELEQMKQTLLQPKPVPVPEPVVKKKKKPARIVYQVDSDDSDDSDAEITIIKKKKSQKQKAPVATPAPTRIVMENPLQTMSRAKIQDDIKKMQMDMLFKSMFPTG